ncbi:MAG: formylglycine-generating enzyme family protein [Magnetococcus sp. YQC-3]
MRVFAIVHGLVALAWLVPTVLLADAAGAGPLGMVFVPVPGGSFEIGCGSWQSRCFDNEKPAHTQEVEPFLIGKYEVTQGQWQAVMGSNPSRFSACGAECPVESVSWADVQTFIEKLNARGEGSYRLPTEVEWEYACRSGGKPEKYCGGDEAGRVSWGEGSAGKTTHPVGGKAPNGLGIHDMSGNVFEWTCSDGGKYDDDGKNHTKCSAGGAARVIRGGGVFSAPTFVRTTYRISYDPGHQFGGIGFRLVRETP